MKIVGLLQNPWFKPTTPQRIVDAYISNYEFRRRVLAMSHTGKMLRLGLGDELFRAIHWTESSPISGRVSSHKEKPDLAFVEKEILGAEIVIAFGTVAKEAMRLLTLGGKAKAKHNFKYLECPHPASRNRDVFLSACEGLKYALIAEHSEKS